MKQTKTLGSPKGISEIPQRYSTNIKEERNCSEETPSTDKPHHRNMSSNYSGRTTPHSDVDHPHRITYSPFNEDEDPQPIPMLPPRPPTPGPIALENRGTQTSPKPCPIHQQHVAIMTIHTPPFARQIQQPHHEEHLCLLKSLGPYGRSKTPIKQESPSPPPLPVRIPY